MSPIASNDAPSGEKKGTGSSLERVTTRKLSESAPAEDTKSETSGEGLAEEGDLLPVMSTYAFVKTDAYTVM
jgi:hypothetical protein